MTLVLMMFITVCTNDDQRGLTRSVHHPAALCCPAMAWHRLPAHRPLLVPIVPGQLLHRGNVFQREEREVGRAQVVTVNVHGLLA